MEQSIKKSMENEEKQTLINWLQRFGSRFETGFIVTEPSDDDPIVFANKAFTKITGYSFEEVEGENLRFLQGEETDMALIDEINGKLRDGISVNEEILSYKKDGTPFWNELVIQPLLNSKGEILYNASFILDVTGRKQDESLLRLQERIFTGINEGEEFGSLLQKICNVAESFFPKGSVCSILFKEKEVGWFAGAAESMPESLLREMVANRVNERDYILEDVTIVKNIQRSPELESVSEVCTALGFRANWTEPVIDADGGKNGVFTIFMKKTGAPTKTQMQFMQSLTPIIRMAKTYYQQREEYLRLAFTDPGTGLPNNHAFLGRLKEKMKKGGSYFVAIAVPGEYSKIVDLYGRNAADELFIQLALRIQKAGKGKENFVGRFSSASLVLTNDLALNETSEFYDLQLKKIVSEPFVVANQEVFLTLKIGIALMSNEIDTAEELLRRADVAMSESKQRPGNTMSFYKDLKNKEIFRDMTVFNELSKALDADELEVYLQPKVNLTDSTIVGFEALARWNSPVLGQVPPIVFIPIAEDTGKIIVLEINMLNKIMKWQQHRVQSEKKMYQVAVNISVDHFFHSSFIKTLKGLVAKYDIAPKYLRLEITESIGLVDFVKAKSIFKELNTIGFEVSIDDFGVGFSSLSYLSQLQVNELKIDRSFVHAIDESATRAVVMTIIQLANNLGLSIVAEGIEEERQIEILLSLGCEIGQGFYYYKPMPLHEADLLIDQK